MIQLEATYFGAGGRGGAGYAHSSGYGRTGSGAASDPGGTGTGTGARSGTCTAKGPMNTSAADAAGVAPAISAIAAPAPANALLVRVPMFTVPFASIPAVDLSPSMSVNLRARSPFRCSACQRVSEHRSYRRTDERCDRQVAHGPRAAVLSPLRQCSPATHGASRPTPTANRSRRHARQPPSGHSTSCTTSLRRRNHGVKGGSNRANLGGPAATSPARAIPASRSAR